MFAKLSPVARCAFCREITRASASCTDNVDSILMMAATGLSTAAPPTPALLDGASADIALIPVSNCLCDIGDRII